MAVKPQQQKITWLQSYTLEVEKDKVESLLTVEENQSHIVTILEGEQWGDKGHNIYAMQFEDGTIAYGVCCALFTFNQAIKVAGETKDIPDELRCPNECDGGDVCVDVSTGQCSECGQFFDIVPTKIVYEPRPATFVKPQRIACNNRTFKED